MELCIVEILSSIESYVNSWRKKYKLLIGLENLGFFLLSSRRIIPLKLMKSFEINYKFMTWEQILVYFSISGDSNFINFLFEIRQESKQCTAINEI